MVTGFSETPRFVKNSNAALIISYFLAALMALFFALGLLPGWVKMSNYAPNEPHVSRWTKPLEEVVVSRCPQNGFGDRIHGDCRSMGFFTYVINGVIILDVSFALGKCHQCVTGLPIFSPPEV